MDISRRRALTGGAGVAVGAVGAVTVRAVTDRLAENTPLPFYGSAASGVRPDRGAPGAASTTVVWGGDPTARRIALTFDDGPHPDWTPKVLAALEAAQAPATFFCLGRNVHDHAAIHRSSVGRHELANHTWDHPDLARFAYDRCRDEISRTTAEIEKAWGVTPTLFRPPYGHVGGAAVLAAAELGLTTVLWSAQAREDVVASHPDNIVGDLASLVRPGSIVLAHDTGPTDRLTTIDRLPRIIERLRSDGYELVTVSTLLGRT